MKILIVEDDHRIATAIKKGIELEKGMTAEVVFDGKAGFDLAAAEQYDCIILDRMLPRLDGLTICTMLREHNIHTPILLLTAKSQTYEKVEGLNVGADDYLTKPFSFEELLARVKALIRRPAHLQSSILTVNDLKINTTTYSITRSGKSINLSQKEYSVLLYLIQHQNSVVTKEQLIEHVWNFDADILPNTVEAVIKNIRKKIDAPFAKPLIHTVRGFGYKISS